MWTTCQLGDTPATCLSVKPVNQTRNLTCWKSILMVGRYYLLNTQLMQHNNTKHINHNIKAIKDYHKTMAWQTDNWCSAESQPARSSWWRIEANLQWLKTHSGMRWQAAVFDARHSIARHTGWAKLKGASAVSFVVVKHVLENFDNFGQVK